MADNNEDLMFEDISSSSLPKTKSSLKAVSQNYGNGVFKHLDKIIKAISFIVSIVILLMFAAVAAVLIMLDKIFAVVAVAVFIVGIILSLIVLFLIYAVGHLISQNNEIIKRL
ncbi:MAG: hypothetical protein ACI4FN_05775 [Acutalibacteraceae bacterium]